MISWVITFVILLAVALLIGIIVFSVGSSKCTIDSDCGQIQTCINDKCSDRILCNFGTALSGCAKNETCISMSPIPPVVGGTGYCVNICPNMTTFLGKDVDLSLMELSLLHPFLTFQKLAVGGVHTNDYNKSRVFLIIYKFI